MKPTAEMAKAKKQSKQREADASNTPGQAKDTELDQEKKTKNDEPEKQQLENNKEVAEEVKAKQSEEGKDANKDAAAAAAAAQEVVMRVRMHCEGCAKKVRRSVQGLEGVEEVKTDCWTNTVVVRGRKAAEDPMNLVQAVQRKSGKKVELISPPPSQLPPPADDGEKTKKEAGEEEIPQDMVVVLKMNVHCESCCQEIKRRILKRKGVREAVPDMKSSQVTVKGAVEPASLADFVHKRTGRKVAILEAKPLMEEPSPPPRPLSSPKDTPADNSSRGKPPNIPDVVEEGPGEGEKADKDVQGEVQMAGNGAIDESEKKGSVRVPPPTTVVAVAPGGEKVAMNDLYYYYYPPYPNLYPYAYLHPQPYTYARNPVEYVYPPYPPEAFTDENPPDACTVM